MKWKKKKKKISYCTTYICARMARDFSNMWDDEDSECALFVLLASLPSLHDFSFSPSPLSCSLALSRIRFSLYRSLFTSIVVRSIYFLNSTLAYRRTVHLDNMRKKKPRTKNWFHRCRSLYVYTHNCPMSGKMIVLVNVQYCTFQWIGIKFK